MLYLVYRINYQKILIVNKCLSSVFQTMLYGLWQFLSTSNKTYAYLKDLILSYGHKTDIHFNVSFNTWFIEMWEYLMNIKLGILFNVMTCNFVLEWIIKNVFFLLNTFPKSVYHEELLANGVIRFNKPIKSSLRNVFDKILQLEIAHLAFTCLG